jgi:hypothetical protein
MSNEEILLKAIEKAIAGGWKGFSYQTGWYTGPHPSSLLKSKYYPDTHEFVIHLQDLRENIMVDLNKLIFNHDFAKALWRYEKPVYLPDTGLQTLEAWQYHLQQMVIADDPIEYLGAHI